MFRETNPQLSLLEAQYLLSPKKAERLKGTWAHVFRTIVPSLVDEDIFRDGFSAGRGRPNVSIKLLVGLHLLKELNDLTDAQVLEQLEYNLQWHYALAVEPDQAHTCQKTLHNFRVLAAHNQRAEQMMAHITEALAKADGVSLQLQRLDSTHIMSNIAQLTRLTLFVETICKFLRELRREAADRLALLPERFTPRYLEREGYFSDANREQARRRLPVVARDLYELVELFAQDEVVGALPSYALVSRLFQEQCELIDEEVDHDGDSADDEPSDDEPSDDEPSDDEPSDDEPSDDEPSDDEPSDDAAIHASSVRTPSRTQRRPETKTRRASKRGKHRRVRVELREPRTISSTSLQSPYDPDATYGHKGKGYELQIAETCEPDNPYQLVTGVALNGAHESDQKALVPMLKQLERDQMRPELMLADTGYGSGANIVASAQMGVELLAPVRDPAKGEPRRDPFLAQSTPAAGGQLDDAAQPLELGEFAFSSTFERIEHCPAGHAPLEQSFDERIVVATFAADGDEGGCSGCALASVCPTRELKDGRRQLRRAPSTLATATRQVEQQTSAFKERYRLRSSIESSNQEFKGRHGGGSLRVRGRERVRLAAVLKSTAMNIKRAMAHHVRALTEGCAECAAAT